MFYSQFILAKKGPLGTIWIAAHLERKLRKNQVADTDIGDSVDSILSPDVPIALRLSSHLLLGVVRIYSRKVNYMFDDCSEALLKIKQAFRSAAVDLPPEESKAPYHSITLPETFDLDDFELPDNDIFHSNFVDHHVSSRDQITLQDPMEGVSYSMSKFGLDERFGDADASGLDLDEGLFLDKIGTDEYANESVDPQASTVSMNPVKQDEQSGTSNVNSQIQVDLDDDDDSNFMDYTRAPCTPGLVDEPNLTNVQEVSACDNHLESECHLLESTVTEKSKVIDVDKLQVDWCSGNNKKSDAIPSYGTADDNSYRSDGMDINCLRQHEEFPVEADMKHATVDEPSSGSQQTSVLLDISLNPTSELVDKITVASDVPCTEGIHNDLENTDNSSSLPVDKPFDDHQGCLGVGFNECAYEISTSTLEQVYEALEPNHHGLLGAEVPGSTEPATNLEKSCCNSSGFSENQHISFPLNPDTLTPHSSSLNNDVHENVASTGKPFLLPCDSNMQQPDQGCGRSTDAEIQSDDAILAISMGEEMLVQGQAYNPEEISNANQIQEDAHAAAGGPESVAHKVDPHEMLVENQDISAEVELPAPEKLLSVPEGHVDQHCNMLLTESPAEILGLKEGDAGSKNISGNKRSVTESTLTEQSLNSVESSRLVKFKRTVESVPGDDDLLSSILVGRSSVLKVKPTPRLSEATSGKRTRLAPRTTPKRKLLMDETMVLHGGMIRQQLTSTADIRRVRKKAPCTLPEISVIQKQHLEGEIFLEPACTGMSTQLSSLHSLMWDLRRIRVCKNEFDGGSLLMGFETGLRSENDRNDSHETLAQPSLFSHDIKSDESPTAVELHLTSQNDESQDTKIENDPEPRVLNAIERSTMGITREASLGDNEVAELIENPLLSSSNLKEFNEINVDIEQTQATSHVDPDVSPQELLLDVDGVEKSHKDGDTLNYSVITGDKPLCSGDMLETAAGVVQSGSITEASGTNPFVEIDTSAVQLEQMADVPSSELDAGVMDINNRQAVNANTEKNGDIDAADEINPALSDDFLSGVVGDGGTAGLLSNVEHEHIPADMYPSDMGLGCDDFMNSIENSEHPEAHQSYMLHLDSGFDLQDQEEWKYSVNDTDFLNVDDDELTEADDSFPQDEEARFTENTGWSSRTRAVSKYLQTMFVKEANHGTDSLSVDNLLVGKSRKEASRMFFETLVLKTRDYIEVEQRNPFDDISIRPQRRLMKSEF